MDNHDTQSQFEELLDDVVACLTADIRRSSDYQRPGAFEDRVREHVARGLEKLGWSTDLEPVRQAFPDIVVGPFGIEVKATESDSWRCVANSVSEGTRSLGVQYIYLVYGKMGGLPTARWAYYGDSIVHVRTSHVPRFEVEIGAAEPLFAQLGVTYEEFRCKQMHEKMEYIRSYARSRLRRGERLWWLEDKPVEEQTHALPLEVRLYMELPQDEKRRLRAEASLLSPGVVGGSRERRKYVDAVMYLLTYHGVLCPQARDLFSAGSVAQRSPSDTGPNFICRALLDIQAEMRQAALTLEDALFLEYWGESPPIAERICTWLRKADEAATDWRPSDYLFLRADDQR